jgi:hypothetical protein
LALAVKECQRLRDVMRATWGPELGPDWKEGWLPIDAEKAPISLDCSVTATAVVPVRTFFMEDPSFAADGVASIGELVLMWIAAIDCGAWWYDQDADAWACDRAKLDARLMASELA